MEQSGRDRNPRGGGGSADDLARSMGNLSLTGPSNRSNRGGGPPRRGRGRGGRSGGGPPEV